MNMTMIEKVTLAASLIKDRFANANETRVDESDFLALGLTTRDIERALTILEDKNVIVRRKIMYAPSVTQSTYPTKASFSSLETIIYSVPVFLLEVNEAKLDEILNEISSAHFDDKKGQLTLGETSIALPPQKNEHCLCRAMFTHPVEAPVDWSQIYEEMTGIDVLDTTADVEKLWHTVYDSMKSVNNRVHEVGGKTLFSWQAKTIQRLY